MACGESETCVGGACVASVCAGAEGAVCVDERTVASCVDGALADARVCDFGCLGGACLTAPVGDGGVADDAGPVVTRDGGVSGDDAGFVPTKVSGGCNAGGATSSFGWLLLALPLLRRRRG
jgi:uncharacterized protein (TIGR03382 family)